MKRILILTLSILLLLSGCAVNEGEGADSAEAGTSDTKAQTEAHSTEIQVEKTEKTEETEMKKTVPVRFGSYNIKVGSAVDFDMSVIAADINSLSLDIVGLQEVDIGTTRVGGKDILDELAKAAGYEYYQFTKAISYKGGEYGTAILSRYPIREYETVYLYVESGMEARAVGHAVIDIGDAEIDFYNTHLSYEDGKVREKQFEELAALVKDKSSFVITGDYNTQNMREFSVIEDSALVNNGRFATFPSSHSAIDNIVFSKDANGMGGWRIGDSGMLASGHSDHNMLWAELHLVLE